MLIKSHLYVPLVLPTQLVQLASVCVSHSDGVVLARIVLLQLKKTEFNNNMILARIVLQKLKETELKSCTTHCSATTERKEFCWHSVHTPTVAQRFVLLQPKEFKSQYHILPQLHFGFL